MEVYRWEDLPPKVREEIKAEWKANGYCEIYPEYLAEWKEFKKEIEGKTFLSV